MTGNEYQKLAMKTNDGGATNRVVRVIDNSSEYVNVGELLNGCLGLSGEIGEFNDMIKKWIFHERQLDIEHTKKELGDILWYIAIICHSFGWQMDDILQMNIDKLKARYPDGFSVEKSLYRDKNDV